MPTTLPRVNVVFKKEIHEQLKALARAKHESLSSLVSDLVSYAIELSEDLALARIGEDRLNSFRRKEALTTEQVLASLGEEDRKHRR